jgi:hypothetical protein
VTQEEQRQKQEEEIRYRAAVFQWRSWTLNKPAGAQIVEVRQILATPQVDRSKLLPAGRTGRERAVPVPSRVHPRRVGAVPDQRAWNPKSDRLRAGPEPRAFLRGGSRSVVSSCGSGGSSGNSRRTIGPSAGELAKLTKPELTGQLRKRGLRVTGGKAEL